MQDDWLRFFFIKKIKLTKTYRRVSFVYINFIRKHSENTFLSLLKT